MCCLKLNLFKNKIIMNTDKTQLIKKIYEPKINQPFFSVHSKTAVSTRTLFTCSPTIGPIHNENDCRFTRLLVITICLSPSLCGASPRDVQWHLCAKTKVKTNWSSPIEGGPASHVAKLIPSS